MEQQKAIEWFNEVCNNHYKDAVDLQVKYFPKVIVLNDEQILSIYRAEHQPANPDSPGEVKQADIDWKQFDFDYIMSDGRLKIFESQADEVYKMYMDWTKSGNENLTYFAFAIAKHFNTLGLSTALAKANAEKEEMRELLVKLKELGMCSVMGDEPIDELLSKTK